MKRFSRRSQKRSRKNDKKHTGFLEALRLYAGMPVEV